MVALSQRIALLSGQASNFRSPDTGESLAGWSPDDYVDPRKTQLDMHQRANFVGANPFQVDHARLRQEIGGMRFDRARLEVQSGGNKEPGILETLAQSACPAEEVQRDRASSAADVVKPSCLAVTQRLDTRWQDNARTTPIRQVSRPDAGPASRKSPSAYVKIHR